GASVAATFGVAKAAIHTSHVIAALDALIRTPHVRRTPSLPREYPDYPERDSRITAASGLTCVGEACADRATRLSGRTSNWPVLIRSPPDDPRYESHHTFGRPEA